jgi:transcriptional regulator with GAF, ATPase, and Fis domain
VTWDQVPANDDGMNLADDHQDEVDELNSLTEHCSELVGAAAAGVMLADANGELSTAAATGHPTQLTSLFELRGDGPCPESFHTHESVIESDLAAHPHRWPAFTAPARRAGIRGALAIPMQWHDDTIGVLGMLTTQQSAFTSHDAAVGRYLAEMTTRCLHYRLSARRAWTLASQLQTALNSRVIIEQAKGVLANASGLHVDTAFELLRTYARTNRLKLTDVCRHVVVGTTPTADIVDGVPPALSRKRPRPPRATRPKNQ